MIRNCFGVSVSLSGLLYLGFRDCSHGLEEDIVSEYNEDRDYVSDLLANYLDFSGMMTHTQIIFHSMRMLNVFSMLWSYFYLMIGLKLIASVASEKKSFSVWGKINHRSAVIIGGGGMDQLVWNGSLGYTGFYIFQVWLHTSDLYQPRAIKHVGLY